AVVAAEPVAPIVATAAVLGLAGLGIDQPFIGTDTEVAAANVQFGARFDRLDLAAAVAVGAIDPVVQSPGKAVHAVLRIARVKADVERPAHIRLAVAVGVLRVEDFGGRRDDDAASPRHDAGGKAQTVKEQGGFDIFAIAV